MGVPTKEELQKALDVATKMREEGKDKYYLAKCLLNLNYRMELMERMLHAAKLYLRSGEGSHEHALLQKAIEKVEQSEVRSTDNLKAFEPD